MRVGIRAPAAMIVAGLVIGTLATPDVSAPPPHANGFVLLAADLHVHSAFGDGTLPAWDIAREARRRGVDVVAITNHNQVFGAAWGRAVAQWIGGAMLMVGNEITAPSFHIVALGPVRTVDWRLPAAEIIGTIHALGGVAIAAHPVHDYSDYDPAALASLDGAEIAHPTMRAAGDADELRAFFERARQANTNLAPIGSSDFHVSEEIGECLTYVFAEDVSVGAVLNAIRAGRTVAQGVDGRLIGDASLVQAVQRFRRPPHVSERGTWERVAVAVTWTGLVLAVIGWPGPWRPGRNEPTQQ
jgi:hypothetical protein